MTWFIKTKELFKFSFAGRSLKLVYSKVCGNNNPREQGSTDRYYGRPMEPRYYNKNGKLIAMSKMSNEQIEEYKQGWEEEEDRKDYGLWEGEKDD